MPLFDILQSGNLRKSSEAYYILYTIAGIMRGPFVQEIGYICVSGGTTGSQPLKKNRTFLHIATKNSKNFWQNSRGVW